MKKLTAVVVIFVITPYIIDKFIYDWTPVWSSFIGG